MKANGNQNTFRYDATWWVNGAPWNEDEPDLDTTEARLKTIVEAERMKSAQQPWLLDFVRGLQSEFEDRS